MLEERSKVRFVSHGVPYTFRPMEVVRVRRVAPRMVRVTLGGPEVQNIQSMAGDDDIRLQIPENFSETPLPPVVQFKPFKMDYPEGAPPSEIRAYTIRRLDHAAGELDIDIVIHGEGIGSRWGDQAQPGQKVTVGGPSHSFVVDPGFESYIYLGDETGLPAIGRQVEAASSGSRITVLAEVNDETDHQEWETAPGVDLTVQWIHRNGAAPGRNDLLASALRKLPAPDAQTYVFGAGESSTIRSIRRGIIKEWGLDRGQVHFAGYWVQNEGDIYYFDSEDNPDIDDE